MCAPDAYDLKYEINAWMSLDNRPDVPIANLQWRELHRTLTEVVGVTVDLIPQAPNAPDMVFTANAGLVRGKSVMLSEFRHAERQVEVEHFKAWFERQGFQTILPPAGCKFEGEGDALFAGETLLAGYLKRSDICSHAWLSESLGLPVLSLELVDNRWYHLDTALFVLTPSLIAFYPGAFDDYAQNVIRHNFDTIEVARSEAMQFACNAVVLGKDVVMPAGCPLLVEELARRGYTPHAVELSEFIKSGGAAKCLTLFVGGQ